MRSMAGVSRAASLMGRRSAQARIEKWDGANLFGGCGRGGSWAADRKAAAGEGGVNDDLQAREEGSLLDAVSICGTLRSRIGQNHEQDSGPRCRAAATAGT